MAFRLEVLPASYGDSLFIQYGRPARPRSVLIDGGPVQAVTALQRHLSKALVAGPWLELLVLTHVDADHIEGLVRLLGEDPCRVRPRAIWFNGWREMGGHEKLSPLQGEFFSALLTRKFAGQHNTGWAGGSVVVPEQGPLPRRVLKDGLALTLLSPTACKLAALRESWRKDLSDKKIRPGDLDEAWTRLLSSRTLRPRSHEFLEGSSVAEKVVEDRFRRDDAPANGSSIAFLAEHETGGSCLFLADAHIEVILDSLRRLLAERQLVKLHVDAVKLAHHGSKFNFDPALLEIVDSPRYIFSTDGSRFGHPDPEVVEAIIENSSVRPPQLLFNYHCETTARWASEEDQARRGYTATFAAAGQPLVVTLG